MTWNKKHKKRNCYHLKKDKDSVEKKKKNCDYDAKFNS